MSNQDQLTGMEATLSTMETTVSGLNPNTITQNDLNNLISLSTTLLVQAEGLSVTSGTVPPLTIPTIPNKTATTGVPITPVTLVATGGTPPYTWSAANLPTGLTLTGNIISGTPTVIQTAHASITVTDKTVPQQQAAQTLTWTVNGAISFTTPTLPNAVIGTPYNQTLSATSSAGTILSWATVNSTGQPITVNLPAGLTFSNFNAPTLTISGTPTSSGQVTFSLLILDSANNRLVTSPLTLNVTGTSQTSPPGIPTLTGVTPAGSGSLTITWTPPTITASTPVDTYILTRTPYVQPPPPSPITIAAQTLPPATIGQSYSATLNASSTAGTITSWMTIDASGNPLGYTVPAPGLAWGGVNATTPGLTITGVPTGSPSTTVFTFKVTDSAGNSTTAGPYTLAISSTVLGVPGAPTLHPISPGDTTNTLTWDPPVNTGGSAILSYTVLRTTSAPAQYTVTYNAENTTTNTSVVWTVGDPALTLPTPTYASHTFNGWFTASSGGSQVNSPYTPSGNVTLYAQWTAVTPPPGGGLTVSGNHVMLGGSRFIFKGVNIESYRDAGNQGLMNTEYNEFSQIVTKFTSIGVNAVRMMYNPTGYIHSGNNFANYCSMMQRLAAANIYFLPCDWSYTGVAISGYTTTSFPTFQQIINYCKTNGIVDHLIMNPYNEPWGNVTPNESQWIAANNATLDYLRTTCGFTGLVVLDTTSWASTDVTTSLDACLSHDAGLLGGTANLCFSNHWYYNQGTGNYTRMLGTTCKTYPFLVGEAGPAYPGRSTTDEAWFTTLMDYIVSTGNPNGNNGFFPWIWWWTDYNQMTNDGLTLNAVGNDVVSHYYSKV